MIVRLIRNLKILPRWVIVLLDIGLIAFSTILGYLLRFNFHFGDIINNHFERGVFVYTFSGLISIFATGSYKGIIRYTGLEDGVRIVNMTIANAGVVCVINVFFFYNVGVNIIPYSVIFISLFSSFLLLFNYRLLVKNIFSYYKQRITKSVRVMIFGAGQTGIVARHVINSSPRMQVLGFIEDDQNKIGKILDGARIYDGSNSEMERMVKELNVDEIVITAKDISYERRNELVDLCIKNQVKIRVIPPVERWVKGELSFNQIKEINIDDLLGRESIRINNGILESDLHGKRILVSGAAGSIGSELVRQLVRFTAAQIILVDQAESALYEVERELNAIANKPTIIPFLADISNSKRIEQIFADFKPDLVYHAAAYKHVPMMEGNPSEAISCNILGTKILADLSVKYGVSKFVMVSTDKAVNPTNVMGCSKRIAEIYVQSLNNAQVGSRRTAFVTTRFGNVLGSNGSVIPLFKKQLQAGGPITVTHPEITRYFMTIPEACQLVLEAGTMGKGGEVFIFDMGKSIKILDLAKKMILLSGLEPGKDIEIVFTGLREGEKLYEELLTNRDNTLATHHEKIMIARVQEYPYDEVNRYVELFDDLIHDRNELKMVALMKELVPEYKSNYSRYEVLDKI